MNFQIKKQSLGLYITVRATKIRLPREIKLYTSQFVTGIKDIFECFMMVLNYRAAVLQPPSLKG